MVNFNNYHLTLSQWIVQWKNCFLLRYFLPFIPLCLFCVNDIQFSLALFKLLFVNFHLFFNNVISIQYWIEFTKNKWLKLHWTLNINDIFNKLNLIDLHFMLVDVHKNVLLRMMILCSTALNFVSFSDRYATTGIWVKDSRTRIVIVTDYWESNNQNMRFSAWIVVIFWPNRLFFQSHVLICLYKS